MHTTDVGFLNRDPALACDVRRTEAPHNPECAVVEKKFVRVPVRTREGDVVAEGRRRGGVLPDVGDL